MKILINFCAVTSLIYIIASEEIKEESTFSSEGNNTIKNENIYNSVQDVKQLIQLLIKNTEENKNEIKRLLAEHDSKRLLVTDCLDVQRLHPSSPDGVYRVTLWKSKTPISVYCDMTSSNGGWTAYQNRYDGPEDFYLDLKAYTEGFENTSAEIWLGLRYIKELADQGNTTLRMDVGAADRSVAYAEWPDFRLGESPGYKLHVGGKGTGTTGDRNHYFSKSQNVKDFTAKGNMCGDRGGWWHGICTLINLNGHYARPGTQSEYFSGYGGMMYYSFKGTESLKTSRMMLRRVG